MGNKASAPLEDERQVPKDQNGDGERAGCDSRLSPLEPRADLLEKNGKPYNKQGSKRNEETIPKG